MKRVVVLGGGESGVGAALLAKHYGYEVFLSDFGGLAPKYREELEINEIPFEEGQHTEEKILNADLLVKSPGISDKVSLVTKAIQVGLKPISEIEFAFPYCQGKIIGITGSNGKSTTTALTYHLFQGSLISAKIGGNYGISFARLVLEDPVDVYVLELSSFQLDNIEKFRPHLAILLNISPDHLDRYDYDIEKYARAKYRIVENQNTDDVFIVNVSNELSIAAVKTKEQNEKPRIIKVDEEEVLSVIQSRLTSGNYELLNPSLLSVHNRFNAQCAVYAGEAFGLDPKHIQKRLNDFKGLEHRMENCGEWKGVQFINDSKATNTDAVAKALESIETDLVWIAGGTDKGNDYSELYPFVNSNMKALICLGVDNEALKKAFDGKIPVIKETKLINEAVREAFRLAEGGATVLLSPACASFDLFDNYMDRGNQFKQAIEELKAEN